ncbi:MAG: type II secretion system protein [bacterium]|nr:type II secretion system protein [bacterium]
MLKINHTQLNSKAFTLAEVLITLAIIGVVAAVSIPSVISNSQQQEFKTGLRKAVNVLNGAITLNLAIEGESPYENKNTFQYLMRHMSVIKTLTQLPWKGRYVGWGGNVYVSGKNAAFYTTDGMRFEVDDWLEDGQIKANMLKLHDSDVSACFIKMRENANYTDGDSMCGGCGSFGMKNNPNNTTKPPCAILVDVNGDRKPTPQKVYASNSEREEANNYEKYWVPDFSHNRVSDIFVILITEDRAIPYGIVAQKAMYSAQK